VLIRLVLLLTAVTGLCLAQRKVDPKNTYQRVIAVVPVVGTGTPADPRRPQYAPWPPASAGSRTAIVGYSHQISDDGRFALVEFVAFQRAAFQAMFNDKTIVVFEKGKDSKATIEAALKRYRKDFDLDKFGTVMP
jgi:hypothetical protein